MTPAQIATLLISIWSSNLLVFAVPSGNHTCTGITKIPVTVLVNVTVPVTFRSYTWCLRVPPRCSKYTTQLRDRIQIHTEMHNKTITVCCRGYVEMEGRCVPACPEGADCPFMRCNRTNHCQCTPGYTGLYCNDPCPRGVWGKDCKRPCDCPTGYTCHHLTGDCFVDDRPARKTTTTTTTTTTTRPTTTDSPFTTRATTLETVKTPVFRFPPPPWVDAPSTTPKKLTTRVIRDEFPSPTTVNKLVQTSFPTFAITTMKTVRPPIVKFLPPPVTAPTTTYTIPPKIIIPSMEYSQPRPIYTTLIPISVSETPTSPKTSPVLLPINTPEKVQTTPEILTTTMTETTHAPSTLSTLLTTSTPEPSSLNNEIFSATPRTTLNPTLAQTSPLLQESTIPIADTTKIIPLKEVVEEKTTVIPEFKVIKVIKTELSTSKVNKLPNIKNQTPPELLTTIKQPTKSQASDVITISNEPVVTNFKTTLLQPSQSKNKKEGSPIIYISPTFKEKTSDVGTSSSSLSKITQKPAIHIFTSSKDSISTEKARQTLGIKVITKEHFSFDDKHSETPKTTTVQVTPPVFATQITNLTTLYDPTHENVINHTGIVQNITTVLEEQKKGKETTSRTTENNKLTTKLPEDNFQEITTQMTKKRSKDLVTKKFEDKILKKIITHRTTSTLSPIQILKELLNVTTKPMHSSSIQEPLEVDLRENQTSVPPILQVEEKESFDYKKSKFDDLAVLSSDKGKKNQEKIKQSKHAKEFKESKLEKPAKIPIPPAAITTAASETETLHKNIIPDNENLNNNTSKNNFKDENSNNLSSDKHGDFDTETTTHVPNNIWMALDPQISVPSITTSFKENIPEERSNQVLEKSIVDTATDANSLVESNTIDTLHTPHNVEVIKDILHNIEDSNYSLINNKMRLIKTETLYSGSAHTGYTAMMVTFGVSIITLIALTATLWLYLKRRKQRPVMRPCIMAYELSEPPPIDIQNFEQTFFCPTFTNNYAEKINRELRELSYDHPRCSQPEPLYAEIRY